MFGFIAPHTDKVSEEEKERYQSVYCGLCHSLRDNYSNIARFCLTFDMTFLILLLSSLYEPKETSSYCNCIFHPGKKYKAARNTFSDYAADITVILAYHKLLDDITDENKLGAKIGKAALQSQYNKVYKKYPKLCNATEKAMKEIAALENSAINKFDKNTQTSTYSTEKNIKEEDISQIGDEISKIFGVLMAIIFTPKDDIWKPTLGKFGANLGRFIYFMDAAIDIEQDIKRNTYNPYNYYFSSQDFIKNANNEKQLLEKSKLEFSKKVKTELFVLAGNACEVFEKLPLEQDLNLMREILYEGMWVQFNKKFLKTKSKENL